MVCGAEMHICAPARRSAIPLDLLLLLRINRRRLVLATDMGRQGRCAPVVPCGFGYSFQKIGGCKASH